MPGLWLLPTRALLLLAWLCFYFWGFSLPSLLLFIPSCRNSLSRRKRTNRRNCQHTNQLSCVLQIHPGAGNWEEKGRAIHWFTAPVKPGESPPPSHTPSPHGWPDAVLQTSLTNPAQCLPCRIAQAAWGISARHRHVYLSYRSLSIQLLIWVQINVLVTSHFSSSGLPTPVPTLQPVIQVFTASINSDFTFKSHFLHLSIIIFHRTRREHHAKGILVHSCEYSCVGRGIFVFQVICAHSQNYSCLQFSWNICPDVYKP